MLIPKPKVGDIIQDDRGRCGKIACIMDDGIMAHPIETEPFIYYNNIKVQTATFWQKYGIGYSGRWFDSPYGCYYLKANLFLGDPHNGNRK